MTSQSGGGGGIKGVTSDGQTPGGLVVAGALTAGNQDETAPPTQIGFFGPTFIDHGQSAVDASADALDIDQHASLTGDTFSFGVWARRSGGLNGHEWKEPFVYIADITGSTQAILQVQKGSTTQFQVDGDGVQVHGKFKTGAAVAHVLGAFSGNAVPIYDEAGTLLGYMPLYA